MATNSIAIRRGKVFRDFRGLEREQRRDLALRILRDERVLADLYDHFLIRESLRERGRSTSWRTYRRMNPALTP